ncbi:preprotein translocase subunit SecG [Betaproteobacteria bacterium]|nr:preprotein translocase subunit SecG [Betaproteobacteria bacterium]GHU00165.1 preprotein translocase subunit SecG [Betaproteobacteria bacterium]GHU04267.1 preprotein translocase subunit SecG [Betaproteobacteria bacterium]GHU12040.1 preprotein translocase subunit SecG [Betaproteobacteria bacterium]GHU22389.1 preprotein translocase subunit SecG [Betaproteobacteria bacterium]
MGSVIFNLVLVVHVLVGLGVIGLVLVQHGKGADMGAAFGSGASGSLFGASGSANFLSRTTAALATVFFISSLGLSFLASKTVSSVPDSIMQGVSAPAATQEQPVAPEAAPVESSPVQAIPQ